MDIINNVPARLVVSVLVTLMTGCASMNITSEYEGFEPLSKGDAINVLRNLRIGDWRSLTWYISNIDDAGFAYSRTVRVTDDFRGGGAGPWIEHYHYEQRHLGEVKFSEVTGITATSQTAALHKGNTHLITISTSVMYNPLNPYGLTIRRPLNKILSALLVLCPNIDDRASDQDDSK